LYPSAAATPADCVALARLAELLQPGTAAAPSKAKAVVASAGRGQ
jgi:hypothetical protein